MKASHLILIAANVGLMIATVTAVTNVAVLVPVDAKFQIVLDGARGEMGEAYHFNVIDLAKKNTVDEIAVQCKSGDAKALLLMDNKAVSVALELQKIDSAFILMPKFVLMTLLVEMTTKGLRNVSGIKYEVPAYTLVTNFRAISKKDITKVGIYYRKSFAKVIEETTKLLAKERIIVIPACIDFSTNGTIAAEDAIAAMNSAFTSLIKKNGVELFFVLADNLLVNSASLKEFWIPKVKKSRVPVIAPLEVLAENKIGLAILAAAPDLEQLGAQVANQISTHFENGTPMDSIGFEPTISIRTTLNLKIANEIGWKLKKEQFRRIDRVFK